MPCSLEGGIYILIRIHTYIQLHALRSCGQVLLGKYTYIHTYTTVAVRYALDKYAYTQAYTYIHAHPFHTHTALLAGLRSWRDCVLGGTALLPGLRLAGRVLGGTYIRTHVYACIQMHACMRLARDLSFHYLRSCGEILLWSATGVYRMRQLLLKCCAFSLRLMTLQCIYIYIYIYIYNIIIHILVCMYVCMYVCMNLHARMHACMCVE